MKKEFILEDSLRHFEEMDDMSKREAVIGRNAVSPSKHWLVISDLNGAGWYVAIYVKIPSISNNGNIFFKTICQSSGTYKNGKFYGCMSPISMLREINQRVPQFNWCEPITRRLSLPKYIIKDILSNKITSQEVVWKKIAKRSYHDYHWKLIQKCKEHNFPIILLKTVCPNWESITPEKLDNWDFRQLVETAYICDQKISCMWSENRVKGELRILQDIRDEKKLLAMNEAHVWCDSEFISQGFTLIDSERLAFNVKRTFRNCVHDHYWPKIKNHKYICFASNDICIGYQVMPDGDVWLDQCRGICNQQVPNAQDIDTMLRPVAQSIVTGWRMRNPDWNETSENELPW